VQPAAVLDALVDAVAGDGRIVAVTQGGSATLGAVDEYSDLDLVVVCRDDAHAAVLAEAPALAGRLGPLLVCFTGDHVGEPRLLICLYGPPLLHVDLKFVRLADLGDRVEEGVSIWRRDDVAETALRPGKPHWPQPDLQWIEDRFWVWVHYCAAKIGRGELFECLDALTQIRSLVLGPLLAVRHGRRPQGVRRLEQYAPESAALERTLGDHTAAGCTEALRATIELYRELRADGEGAFLPRRDAEAAAVAYLDDVTR
jgi:hypothetical protein